uniref:Uncharacterized protein n=1 Tax=Ditylenchus dipsaci TaxID=166011 RepID=A0A915DNJ8_9BILA
MNVCEQLCEAILVDLLYHSMQLRLVFFLYLCCCLCESIDPPTTGASILPVTAVFALKQEDLPDEYTQFMIIESKTKDITVTLRPWHGALPGGLKIRLFTARSENLVFRMLPPNNDCMEISKKALFLFCPGNYSYAKFGWRTAKRYHVFEVGTSLNESRQVYSQKENGDVQFSIVKVEHSLAQLNVVGRVGGNYELSNSLMLQVPGNFEWKKAGDVNADLATESFPFYDDFEIGNDVNKWTPDFVKNFSKCYFQFLFSGDAYRVLSKDAVKVFSPRASTERTTPSEIESTEPPPTIKEPEKEPEESKLVSVLVGVSLFQCVFAFIVLCGFTGLIMFRYYFPKNEKPSADSMLQPSSAAATASRSTEAVRPAVSTPVDAAIKENKP